MGQLILCSPAALPLLHKAQVSLLIGRCMLSLSSLKRGPTHYETLGVKTTATSKEIKDAFVKHSKKMHPDMNQGDPKLHDKFVSLNEAYSTLNKSTSRLKYDQSIGVAFHREPIFRPTNPKTYNQYQDGPPPYAKGSQAYYEAMLRDSRLQYENRKEQKAHSSPFYTFSPFILTLSGFAIVYILFVQNNESERHQRMMTAHELTWRKMEQQNKELAARRVAREQEAGAAAGGADGQQYPQVVPSKPKENTKTIRERKRLAKEERLKRDKEKRAAKKSEKESQNDDV